MKIFILTALLSVLLQKHSLRAEESAEMMPTEVLLAEIKSPQVLDGGNSVGVGGDVIDTRRLTAWFYGDKPIVTCYQYVDGFGADAATVEAAVKRSIGQWQEYFKVKKLDAESSRKINTNFAFKGRCVGEEDLVLHFGTGPIFGNLRDLKTVESLNKPVAYVNKTYMSRDLMWSKGYIRFVGQGYYAAGKEPLPDWKKKDALQTVINHELGHVLGFMHTEKTVMDAGIISDVFLQKNSRLSSAIDGSSELVFCSSCEESFSLETSEKAAETFFKKIGLAKPKKVVLQKSSDDFWLTDGERRLRIGSAEPAAGVSRSVLLSNFAATEPIAQKSFTQYGYVDSSEGRQAVILSYNENREGESRLVLRLVRDGAVVPGASFSRTLR